MPVTTDQKVEILYKKYVGAVNAKPGYVAGAEPPVSAKPKIIPGLQIWNQDIPDVALTSAQLNLSTEDGTNKWTKKYTGKAYSYIVKYENVQLAYILNGISYRFKGTNGSAIGTTNILSDAIPGNYDPAGTYAINVFDADGLPILPDDATHPWVFDGDAGYLTFLHTAKFTDDKSPTISFWRYEGTKGLLSGSGSGGSSNASTDDFNVSKRLFVTEDADLKQRLFVSGDVSMNNRLFVYGDASFNNNLFVSGNANVGSIHTSLTASFDGKVTIDDDLYVTGDISLNNRLFAYGDVSFNNKLSVNDDVRFAKDVYTSGKLFQVGDVSMNNRLFVSGDVSLNGSVFINGSLTVQQYQQIINTTTTNYQLIVAEDISLNGRFFVNDDVSFNKNVFVHGDVSINGALHAKGVIPSGGSNGYVLTKKSGNDYDVAWSQSSGGSGSGNATYNDAWVQSNLIDSPPALIFGTPIRSTTEIIIPWTYPTQTEFAIFTSWVPAINTISATLSVTFTATPTVVDTINVLTKQAGNDYINTHVAGQPYITAIILSKNSGTNGVYQRTINGVDTRAYIKYDTTYANIITPSSGNNKLYVWYENANPNNNKSTSFQTFTIFASAGKPSAPNITTIDSITNSSARLLYTAPTNVDVDDTSSSLTIVQYDVSFSSPGSSLRYNAPVADTARAIFANNGTALSYSATSMYPDSDYIFQVRAKNSGNILAGNAAKSSTITTLNLTPTIGQLSTSTVTFAGRYYNNGTTKRVSDGATKSNIVNTNTNWLSSSFSAPIHNVSTRGSANTSLMTLATTITNNSITSTGPSAVFDGFGKDIPIQATASNVTLIPLTTIDSYNGQTAKDGFYLHSTNQVQINNAAFVASPYDYQLAIAQSGTYTGSSTVTFQYDTPISTAPTITSTSFNFNGLNTNCNTSISGVKVVYGSPIFTVSTEVNNMGNYYYSSPYINYSNGVGSWSPASETDLANITSGKSSDSLASSITISNAALMSASLASTYSNAIQLSITANNIKASTSATVVTPISAIVDGPSVALVALIQANTTISPTTTTVLSNNTYMVGYHIPSAAMVTTNDYFVPALNNDGTGYHASGYSHAVDITSTPDLQISNGKFVTPSHSSSDYAYANYTSYKYDSTNSNTVNYTTISNTGYRFATFAWKVTAGQYASLSFKMDTPSPALTKTSNLAFVNSTKLVLLYRIDEDNKTPSASNTMASAWIDGNRQSGTTASSGNYYLPTGTNAYTTEPNSGLSSFTSATAQFDVALPSGLNVQTENVYIYCRVGIPMNEAFSFRYMTAKLNLA